VVSKKQAIGGCLGIRRSGNETRLRDKASTYLDLKGGEGNGEDPSFNERKHGESSSDLLSRRGGDRVVK